MKISTTMDLQQLAKRMGSVATEAEARWMRAILAAAKWDDTDDVPDADWDGMLAAAVKAAAQ